MSLGDLYNPHDLPSADDPRETLEQSIERLTRAIDAHVERFLRVRETLRTFYLAPLSASSVAPILALAEELNPDLALHRSQLPGDDEILTPSTSPF